MSVIDTIKNVGPLATRLGGRTLLKVQKYSPEILTAVGIAGTVASTILIAKATLKVEPIIEDIDEKIKIVKEVKEASDEREDGQYTDKQFLKDKVAIYTKGVVELTKLYGGPVSLELLSIGCILTAHGIMRKRQVALVAAYKTLETAFAQYRNRVEEHLDADLLADIRNGIRTEQQEQADGKIEAVRVVDPDVLSEYHRFYDESNPNWDRNQQNNIAFLRGVQNYANDMLKARGYIFLNDVLQALGFAPTAAGQITGWKWGEPGHDSFVDFGIYSFGDDTRLLFPAGKENDILLNFNVGGVIWDLI